MEVFSSDDNDVTYSSTRMEQSVLSSTESEDIASQHSIITSSLLSSSSPPPLYSFSPSRLLPPQENDISNESEHYYANGFPFSTTFHPSMSTSSPSLYTSTNDSAILGVVEAVNGSSIVGSNEKNFSQKPDNILSLPIDFTEISDLNKNCIIVYTVLFFVAAVSNLLVLSCVSRHDRLGKSRTPLLIMNLCIADLIVTFFLMPTEIFWRYTIAWKGGDLLCKLSQFVRAFGLYLSSNVVICISVDRYFAIVYPLKLAGAAKRVKWMLVGAWLVSAVFAGPQIFIYHVASHPEYPEFRQCVTQAFLKTGPYNELIYNVSSVAALYFIPLVVIIFTYTMILWKIHKKSKENMVANSQKAMEEEIERSHFNHHPSGGTVSTNQLTLPASDVNLFNKPGTGIAAATIAHNFLHRTHSKRTRLMLRSTANQTATLKTARTKTLKLTLLILISFMLCYSPYSILVYWYMLDREGASQLDERLQEALFILAVTNSVLNPLIYGAVGRSQDCKKRLHSLLHSATCSHPVLKYFCCCCIFKRCFKQIDNGNSDTVVYSLHRVNGSSIRRDSRVIRSPSIRSRRASEKGTSYVAINLNNITPSAASPISTSSRTRIITVKGNSNNNNNSAKVLKFVRSMMTGNSTKQNISNKKIIVQKKNECVECGVAITFEYNISPSKNSTGSQQSTPV